MAFQSRLETSPVRFLAHKVLLVGLLFWLGSTTGSLLVADEAVDRLLGQAGVKKGIAVVLGLPGGDVAFPTRLAQSSGLLVHVQLQSVDELQASREQARRQGLLGSRVTIEAGDAKSIYLASNIADLVYLPAGNGLPACLQAVLLPAIKASL